MVEYVPLILFQLLKLLQSNKTEPAINLLDSLGISNEMFKEHLMDLCMDTKLKELFDKLST